ncbi:MAG TPA: D-alanine--D-alanine ligase [Selenomonadales bacterium]|nr:D-alanine--D-alanine ligase [Selenomonadales bacterium]
MKNKRIAVVMGGPSAEREVSLNTGKAILAALREKGYDAVAVDLEPKKFMEQLREAEADVVFNAIHGKYGEDGLLQGALEMLGIPYTGSGVLASAVAMDKGISKRLFLAAGISTPHSRLYGREAAGADLCSRVMAEFGLPVVVKPATQGSSLGVTIVQSDEALAGALEAAFGYGDEVLVEEFIRGKEVTVSILGADHPEALPIIEIVPHSGKYDYTSKYTKGATEYIVPARLDEAATLEIQQQALAAFRTLGCRGIGRVDVMLDAADRPYVLEVNTIPGMTATSLVPKAAAAAGLSFAELCERILLMASA